MCLVLLLDSGRPLDLQVLEAARLKAIDTRSFIMRKPALDQSPPIRSRLGTVSQNEDPPLASRMVQARYDSHPNKHSIEF